MSMPMNYERAKTLCAGTQGDSIQLMLMKYFSRKQVARVGTYVDREKAYLMAHGCRSGSRYDMWKQYVNMNLANYWWSDVEGLVSGGAVVDRVLLRSYTGVGAIGAVAGGSYSFEEGA